MSAHSAGDLLVVEDDPDTRANLRDILELDGYRVEEAGTVVEALRRTDWPRFAAVILDRRLPDGTADSVLPELKRLAPHTSVIVVTGYSDLQGAVAALRQGASDYILKPLNTDALRASLDRIAERRKLALAKERSDAAFRHLVEAAEAMIVIVRPDGRIAYLSPYAERLTGFTAAEVVGRDFRTLFLSSADGLAPPRECARIPDSSFEAITICRDGTRRSVVWNSRHLDDYAGEPACLAIGHDITGLKEAQERALQAERLAAIGQVVTGLAHESRNALQRSQACLEMLALRVADRPDALDLIARIQKAQDHLHCLYEDVRDYAAPVRLDRRKSDLGATWREAWDHLEPARRGRDARLVEAVSGVDLSCPIDPFRMVQVFQNLFENALAAVSGPVRISIRAREAELAGRPALRVEVRDNGPGFSPEQRRQAFDAFYTTKTKGTGLGLAIVRRIVESHGGQVVVGDDEPPGAEFLITLPRELP
jgi:PAS domain S-box-containing protein